MSTNHTANYDLCQWEATDQVLRTDFNQDNAKIDAALAALAGGLFKMRCGYYVGNDAPDQTFTLGFTPKVVLVLHNTGKTYRYENGIHQYWGGLAVEDSPLQWVEDGVASPVLWLTFGGFVITNKKSGNYESCINIYQERYTYLAFG